MSRINLNKNKAELQKAWEDLHKPNSKNDWVVFGYDGKTFDLKIVGTGEDGFEEMIDDLSGGKIMYAGCRVNDPNTNLPKIVFVNWQGEGVPTNVKGTCANHIRDVTNFFRGAHVTVTARSEDDLDYDTVLEKVKNSSGSNYSFHKEKPKPAEKIKPVGAVYKKTNPMAEINTNNRDKFWSQQQKEEQSRQEQEKLRIEKEREEEDRKRRDREAKEAAARDQAVRERSQSIDKQRAAQRALEQKKKDEEKKKYQETLKDAEIQDREFRKRSDSERRKRLMEAQGMIRQRTNSIDKERQRFEAPAEKKLPPPTIPKKVIRKPVLAPAEPTPEPIREPTPQPIRELTPEPIREPTPEPIREPTPEPVPEPIEPEPQPEIEPEPVQVAEPVVEPQEPEQPSIPEDIYDEVTQEESPVQDDIYENIDESHAAQPVAQEVHQEEAPVQEDIYENIEESPSEQPVAQEALQPSVQDSPASTAGCTARALYDYQAEGEDEITFDPDDIITNIDKFDEGWWRGTAPSGKSGIFPSNYVEVISEGQSVSVEESSPAVEETPAASQGLRARALYDYQATDDTEITFDPDDIITDIEQIDEGWWRGAGPDGRYGLFPANYVELI